MGGINQRPALRMGAMRGGLRGSLVTKLGGGSGLDELAEFYRVAIGQESV